MQQVDTRVSRARSLSVLSDGLLTSPGRIRVVNSEP